MKHIKSLDAMPRRVKAHARLWAIKTMAQNPDWCYGGVYIDEWKQVGDYDINLWVEDCAVRVLVYPTYIDENGWQTTDTDECVTVVRKGDM